MATFSKSPWSADGEYAVFDADGNLLFDPWDATEDDMRLAAASPDLYAALKAAEEELRLIRMKDSDVVYNPMLSTQIALAFAKAEN